MRYPNHSRSPFFLALAGLMAAVVACSIGSPGATASPTVAITFPQAGSTLSLGQQIVVQSMAANPKGVARVELWVDGQVVNSQVVAPTSTSYSAGQPWTPAVAGSHAIEVRAYGVDNAVSVSSQVVVTVAQGTPLAGGQLASPLGTSTPAPTPIPAAPPTVTPTAAAVAEAASSAPAVTANIALNVRSGPGVNYPIIGGLLAGQSAPITGKSGDGQWWQIVFPLNTNGQGWVSAQAQFSNASNSGNVPIVAAPPPPTPTPTPTFTPSPTPVPEVPTSAPPPPPPSSPGLKIKSFTADHHYTILSGDSVKLSWKVQGADSVRLEHDATSDKVDKDHGDKTYSPAVTTVYTLVARQGSDTTDDQLTVTVVPPPTIHVNGWVSLNQTYLVDLDTASIVSTTAADLWFEAATATKRYITPKNGAEIVKMGNNEPGYLGCQGASYHSSQIKIQDVPAGTYLCVRTNGGRFSQLHIDDTVGPSPGVLKFHFIVWN
jgi:uncharacterized protein YgiM (DUF1202 family)